MGNQIKAERLATSQAAVERLAAQLVAALVPRLVAALAPALDQHVRAQLQPAPPPELVQLVRAVHSRFGEKVWAVRDLCALGYVAPADSRTIGQDLGILFRAGGRVGNLRLVRRREDGRAGRDGHEYKVLVTGGDDGLLSPHDGADTMKALQLWSQKR